MLHALLAINLPAALTFLVGAMAGSLLFWAFSGGTKPPGPAACG